MVRTSGSVSIECGLGLDGAECNDLRNAIAPPPVGGVAHHLSAAAVVEVDIDIRHGGTFRVEEPLEQQAVLDGVDIGDPQCVGHQRSGGRSAARTDPDVDRACVVDQIGHNQKVGRITLIADDIDLIGRALDIVGGHTCRKAAGQAGIDLMAQPARLRLSLRHREHRHPVARGPHIGVGLHPLGDQQCGVAGLRDLAVPQGTHLGRRLQVVAVAIEFESGRVRERLSGLHTEQRLVVVRGIPGDVMAVVGRQWRDTELATEFQQPVAYPALDGKAVIHQLKEVVLRAEDFAPLGG